MRIRIRPIAISDNAAVARIIKNVMPEFGADGEGFAIHDLEVDQMYEAYQGARFCYFVCEVNGQIVGGGGIAPLEGGDDDTCELKKMYFIHSARSKGLGRQLLMACIRKATELGYRKIYLETFHTMHSAIRLYEANGFKKISHCLGNTGHFACDNFYLLDLPTSPADTYNPE